MAATLPHPEPAGTSAVPVAVRPPAALETDGNPAGLEEAARAHAHLARHLDQWVDAGRPLPRYTEHVTRAWKNAGEVNLVYPVGAPVFIHVHDDGRVRRYLAIQPSLDDGDRRALAAIRERILRDAPQEAAPESPDDLRASIRRLFDRNTRTATPAAGPLKTLVGRLDTRTVMDPAARDRILYHLERDIVESGPLEPLIRDPNIEDIHAIGTEPLHVIHKVFDMVETNIRFEDAKVLDDYLRNMTERIGRPVSASAPIVDATLPDGSRINVVYSEDVSRKGPSFTIRKFAEVPTSITQVCQWGTMSTRVAAYLWLCLEHGMSVFVCGETASGKTTTLNGILPFIKADSKVFTAEDTPEVRPPHDTWQQLVTRESGPEEGRVGMFDLLKAALRSRPNYIIVGEIRGAEGAVAFSAMQTGHPCLATFHASSVGKMIQRLSSDPINVPLKFMDNLNVCLVQMAVYNKGRMLRRVLAVEEIEGYSAESGGVVTRRVATWDPAEDELVFRGRNNSYVLENRIAPVAGYTDKRAIYEELDRRTRVLDGMIAHGILEYSDVHDTLERFHREGPSSLPFPV